MYLLTHRLTHEASRGPLKLIVPTNGTGTLQHDERDISVSFQDERYINYYLENEITAQNAIEKLANTTAIMELPDNQYEITIEFEGKYLTDKELIRIAATVSVTSDKNLTDTFEKTFTLFYVSQENSRIRKMFPKETPEMEVNISGYRVFRIFYASLRGFFIEVLKSLEKQQDFIEFIENTTQYGEDIISNEG